MMPRRACSSWVIATKPAGARHFPSLSQVQSRGMKSHAVLSLGSGIPGVSGEENVHGVPTRPRNANDPGVVPQLVDDELPPSGGSVYMPALRKFADRELGRASHFAFPTPV